MWGITLLHTAAERADREMIRYLVDNHNFSVNAIDDDSKTPLMCACEAVGNLDNITTLLTLGADVNMTTDSTKDSALHIAAENGDPEMIKCLLDQNTSVNVIKNDKSTPLMMACRKKNNISNVATLLEHGADVNMTCESDTSALHYAAFCADSETVKSLILHNCSINGRSCWGTTPLLAAISSWDVDKVVILLEHGADVNVTLEDGASALHLAAQSSLLDIVKLLLNHNISVNVINNNHRTPLIAACSIKNNVSVVEELLSAGADINMVDKEGTSALHNAAENSDIKTVKCLLHHNVSIMADNKDSLPLLARNCCNNLDNAMSPMTNCANLKCISLDGRNCLHFAALNSDEELITYMIEQGVPVNVFDKDEKTLLSIACEFKKLSNVERLVKLNWCRSRNKTI